MADNIIRLTKDGIFVTTHGLPNLREVLASIPVQLRKRALLAALRAAGGVVRKAARAKAPRLKKADARKTKHRTQGTLRRAISVRNSKLAKLRGNIGVFINVRPAKGSERGAKSKTDPFYWRFINWGWTPASGPRKGFAGSIGKWRRKRASRAVGAVPSHAGVKFLEAGAAQLGRALEVFKQRLSVHVAKLNNKGKL